MRPLMVLIMLAAMTSCTFVTNTLHPPANDVDAALASLSAADTAALAYVNLPVCGTVPAGQLCSTFPIIRKIEKARQVAYTAVKLAEQTKDESDIQIAQSAILALQNIVSTVQE